MINLLISLVIISSAFAADRPSKPKRYYLSHDCFQVMRGYRHCLEESMFKYGKPLNLEQLKKQYTSCQRLRNRALIQLDCVDNRPTRPNP